MNIGQEPASINNCYLKVQIILRWMGADGRRLEPVRC